MATMEVVVAVRVRGKNDIFHPIPSW
ncbi:uncharacterized protein G2W53_040450 [Senna tora]|uniref:Uncharacterized protein n=1 Tax=Senna tora TaxID=362788 RepID=A0A834SDN6_9FABA|nr:uncharacterized protein G2W53_040450 [Senna tora]